MPDGHIPQVCCLPGAQVRGTTKRWDLGHKLCSLLSCQVNHVDEYLRNAILCYHQNFGFAHHGSGYRTLSLLAPNRVLLSQRGKRALAQELAGLVERALN